MSQITDKFFKFFNLKESDKANVGIQAIRKAKKANLVSGNLSSLFAQSLKIPSGSKFKKRSDMLTTIPKNDNSERKKINFLLIFFGGKKEGEEKYKEINGSNNENKTKK